MAKQIHFNGLDPLNCPFFTTLRAPFLDIPDYGLRLVGHKPSRTQP
jgi:hypothetical protein